MPLPLLPKLSIIGGGYGSVGKWDTGTLPLLTVGGSSSSLGSNSFLTSGSVPRVALCPKDTFAHGFNRLYVRERASKSRLETAMTGLELYCQRPESQQEDNDKIVGVTLNEAKGENVKSNLIVRYSIFGFNYFVHYSLVSISIRGPNAPKGRSSGTFVSHKAIILIALGYLSYDNPSLLRSGFQVLAPTQTAPQLTGDGVHAGLGDVKAHCSDGINLFTGPAPSPDISKVK